MKVRFWAAPGAALLVAVLMLGIGLSGCKSEGGGGTTDGQDTVRTDTVPEIVYNRYWNDLARMVGGMPPLPGSVLARLDTTEFARSHRAFWDEKWGFRDTNLLVKMAAWARQEFPREHESTGNALYPLSGSDVMHIHQFYPNAKHYVFFALETEGTLMDSAFIHSLSAQELQTGLVAQQKSLADIFRLTFQITQYMGRDLGRSRLDGQQPIILAFLARTGNEVLNVEPITLTRNAQVEVMPTQMRTRVPQDSIITGLRYTFRRQRGAPVQTLDYWCLQIEDQYINRNYPYFVTYIKNLKPARVYFKAASYLMHYDEYKLTQQAILDASEFILQDDSGFPYQRLKDGPFDITLYGDYDKPKLAQWGTLQPELKRIYQTDTTIRDLPFGLGYTNNDHNCNMQIARRRAGN